MSVEVELSRFNWNDTDLTIGASGDTLRKVHVWYDIGDRIARAQDQVGNPLGTLTVKTIIRSSAKEFTLIGEDGTPWTLYRKGCGCGG